MNYFSLIYKDDDGSYIYFLTIFKQGIEKPINYLSDRFRASSSREAVNIINSVFNKYVSTS